MPHMPRGQAKNKRRKPRPVTARRQPKPAVTEPLPPVPVRPPGRPLPQRPADKVYYHSAIVFALGIITVAAILFAVVREVRIDRIAPPQQSEAEDPLFADIGKHPEFRSWISTWRTVEPYVSVAEFTLQRRGAVQTARPPEFAVTPPPEDLLPPRANRYVWSPEKTRFVDYLGSYGEPDSGVELYDRAGEGKLEMLAYCGTPCRFNGALWLDDHRVAVLGIIEGQKEDGTPLCLPTSAGSTAPKKCYERLTVTVYDLDKDEQTTYWSENHLFGADPFEDANRDRWISGLLPEELAVAGLSRPGDVEVMRGTVVDITADARILTLDGDRVRRFVAVASDADMRDEKDAPLPFEALQKGFTVEVRAVTQADKSILATSLRVLAAPNIIVHDPAAGTEVGSRFSVRGVARTFEGNVQVRVKNDRTGKEIAKKFTTARTEEAGAFGPFAIELRIPAGAAVRGDALTLEAYETSAEDGSEINKVIIPLKYRP